MIEAPDFQRASISGHVAVATAVRATFLFALVLVCGCATRGNADLLEARLRQQEDRLFSLQSHLEETQAELAVARKEADGLRTQLASQGEDAILPEQASVLYRVEGIQFNSLLTGGLDGDGIPGDDLISAVLVPHDVDGDLLKLPGKIEIELLDLSQPEDRQRIGRWEFPLEESRDYWHRGLVGSGYLFKLALQEKPVSSPLLLHARMTTPDDRQFDTSTQVEINTGNPASTPQGRDMFLHEEEVPQPEPTVRQTTFHRLGDGFELSLDVEEAREADRPLPADLSHVRTSDSWTDGTIPRYR